MNHCESTDQKPAESPRLSLYSVESVEGNQKPEYCWEVQSGHDRNFRSLGKLLATVDLELYRHPDGGLVVVEDDNIRWITTAKELTPLLVDTMKMAVYKDGKYKAEHPSDSILNTMLASRTFLDQFEKVDHTTTTPVVLSDCSVAAPGWNPGGILYLRTPANPASLDSIPRFLDVMDFDSEASRTNAVAALLTIPFRFHFPGGKPLVLISATKSHSGKGTLTEFIKGGCPKSEILFEAIDWPMQRQLHEQLVQKPEIGVLSFDNVRTDSAGRTKTIRSAFLESFITNNEVVLSSASSRNRPLRMSNSFVVMLNTNEGSLSPDLLNRSLPIRLTPTGDLQDRVARTNEKLGGDIKNDWLPANQRKIEAEMLGMIELWLKKGKPLNEDIRHPMGPWAKTIGGILTVNGFSDFLANYGSTRATADPIREALGILAFRSKGKALRSRRLAHLAVQEGLAKTLMPGTDHSNDAACERAIGVAVSPYVGETFRVSTPTEILAYRLEKQQSRFDEKYPHYRYAFVELSRSPMVGEQTGLVLEERSATRSVSEDVISEILKFDIETLTKESQ